MNRISSFLAPIIFFSLASITDIVGVVISGFQITTLGAIATPIGAGAAVLGTTITFFEQYITSLGFTDSVSMVALILFSAQAALSLPILVLFFSFVLSAPRGRYSISTCLIGLVVFLLECMPFISGFPFWSCFAWFLRGKTLFKPTPSFGKK